MQIAACSIHVQGCCHARTPAVEQFQGFPSTKGLMAGLAVHHAQRRAVLRITTEADSPCAARQMGRTCCDSS